MSEIGNNSMIQVISVNGKTSYQLVTGNPGSAIFTSASSTEPQIGQVHVTSNLGLVNSNRFEFVWFHKLNQGF